MLAAYSGVVFMVLLVFRRTVNDKVTGKEIQLTDEELDLIHKMQNADYPSQAVDPYAVGCMYCNVCVLYFVDSLMWISSPMKNWTSPSLIVQSPNDGFSHQCGSTEKS